MGMTADSTCARTVVNLLNPDNKPSCGSSDSHNKLVQSVTLEVEDNYEGTDPMTEQPEDEIILGETIFCRQVDTLTYIEGPDEPISSECVITPDGGNDQCCGDAEQIRTMRDPENGKTNTPATAGVSAEAAR